MMMLSIVTTMYYSAPYLDAFYRRSCAVAEQLTSDIEFIFVNDGSPDEALQHALSLHKNDHRVKVIDLSRNFGHHKAMMTGLKHSQGDLVFLIDCDLEIAPETLLDFYQKRIESNADVVFGVQDNRHDTFANKLFANAFYIVFNWLSDIKIPTNVTTARLMTRRYVSALVAHQEREIMIAGLWAITGFKQELMLVTKAAKGSSTYNSTRKIAILITSVTAFSNRPLILVFYLGSIISLLSGLSALYIIVRIIFFGTFLAGWPSVIVSIWFLGGLIIQCVGIIGIYLSKVFTETKQRPYTIIREIYDRSKSSDL